MEQELNLFIDDALLFRGKPIPFFDICKVYPLTIGEIYSPEIGKFKYDYRVNLLTMDELDIKERFEQVKQEFDESITPLSYLLISASINDSFFVELTDAFNTFIKEKVILLPEYNKIVVGDPLDKKFITEDNFIYFQNILRAQNKIKIKEIPPINEDPRMKKFRLKKEMREKVKTKKGDPISFGTILSSVCVSRVGITPENIDNYCLYTVKELLDRAQLQEKYQSDIRLLAAGADPKEIKPKYWVKNNEI